MWWSCFFHILWNLVGRLQLEVNVFCDKALSYWLYLCFGWDVDSTQFSFHLESIDVPYPVLWLFCNQDLATESNQKHFDFMILHYPNKIEKGDAFMEMQSRNQYLFPDHDIDYY